MELQDGKQLSRLVEKGKPVDLLCMPGSRCAEGARVIHVEAKGTTSSGSSVHLTRNEVADAREAGKSWRSDLFVVSGIELRQDASGAWLARGGEAALFERWSPSDEDLTPTDFVCRLPRLSRR